MKRILILSDINSAHTQKWVGALSGHGFEIGIFTLSLPVSDWYKHLPNVSVLYTLKKEGNSFSKGTFSKVKYIKVVPQLTKIIQRFKPDLLHAHYATSYGLIGALSNFHPYIISAWGSDVMDFPNKSYFHKKVIQFNFKKADVVLATSNAIKEAVAIVSDVKVKKIPFGIDTETFKPIQVERVFTPGSIVIGTIKSLESIYGIDILIRAFKDISDKHRGIDLKLLIVGGGSKEANLRSLVKSLDLESKTVFTGKVEYASVPSYHNMIDIFVNVSRNESFGVAVLESSACEKAVIASNIGGLKEVLVNNATGILVEPENVAKTAEAIEMLVLDKTLRDAMGIKGRKFVKDKFEFSHNVSEMIEVYQGLLLEKK